MGRKSKIIHLTAAEKKELTQGFKYSQSSNFSRRCHYILLKHQGKTSQEIADIFGTTIQPINRWCNRYLENGIAGLQTKKGQGRKKILDRAEDESIIKATVQQERQR